MPPPSRQVFGQTMKKKGAGSNYRRQFGGGSTGAKTYSSTQNSSDNNNKSNDTFNRSEYRRIKEAKGQAVDVKFGIERFGHDDNNAIANAKTSTTDFPNNDTNDSSKRNTIRQKRGWLYNILPTTVTVSSDISANSSNGAERSGLEMYFCTDAGKKFKSTILYRPYFYIIPDLSKYINIHQNRTMVMTKSINTTSFSSDNLHSDDVGDHSVEVILELITSHLFRQFEGTLYHVEVVYRIDLDQINHLSPQNKQGRPMLKLTFDTVAHLMEVRGPLREKIVKNQERGTTISLESFTSNASASSSTPTIEDSILKEPLQLLCDMREYDVPYVVRVCTDLDIRAGTWYTVQLDSTDLIVDSSAVIDSDTIKNDNGGIQLLEPDRESKAEPVSLAFDIECTKAPLKFPSAEVDEIFMISYMVSTPNGGAQGYLITSRTVVSSDVDDFEYTPKPTLPGPFHIFNEENEHALLKRFFAEFQKHSPQIVITYNGDFFDWPFVDTRAKQYGIHLYDEIGIDKTPDGYSGRCCVHMDAFHWVQRDSYLPQGSQGLKAVTKYKLKYDPVEVDPEDMVKFAKEKPVHMATYSVSDAVATYYLYEKYVHLFIFSLCTIIPMSPEDVLRKGSGTLCETLLMVQACQKLIICPNKETEKNLQFHNGHLLESETYIGGKVECLETGVYRSDVEYDFNLEPTGFQRLIDNVDRDLSFAIQVESGKERSQVVNYHAIRQEIVQKLELLRDRPKRKETPFVYHLDVGAMYPNIILTNRLQPSSIVNDTVCAACDFNQSKNGCKRRMNWIWRGDYNPATYTEFERTRDQLSKEHTPDGKLFNQLSDKEQAELISDRLKKYSNKAYKRTKITEEATRSDIVCMRENDFYVGTVRQFRDRRYDYKRLNKMWNKKLADAKNDPALKKQCEDKVLVYDSLQIAHKCILNSFYGYVMRRGARWRSMEMAGIVTKTGSDIITQARQLVEQIGRPLELDTDGIWCILPSSFPNVYNFDMVDGTKLKLEYPCAMLNADVHDKFTNHQYQELVNPEKGIYETRSECSIFFEVDGPYRCMVIPASTEEGKLLKKRYAVFNFDGSLAELKGFELKRRGELELIKTFQSQVFDRFLDGTTLEECYTSVAEIANHWIDVIDTRGESLDEDELFDLISENRSMSRQLEDYGTQKGTSQTTARRLAEFLGSEIVKDKGLNCKFIIAEQPFGAPVTERSIPTAIWKAEPAVMKHYLRKWLKAPALEGEGFNIRNILDWDYYLDRLAKSIQKIITIPAALQKVSNPVPRIPHPAWLESKVNALNDRFQQKSLRSIFEAKKFVPKSDKKSIVLDIEDINGREAQPKRPMVTKNRRVVGTSNDSTDERSVRVSLSKDNFPEWLKQRKQSWKILKQQKRILAKDGDESGVLEKRQRTIKTVEALARDAAISLTQNEWHIIEVRAMSSFDTSQPFSSSSSGEFIAWVMAGSDSLQKIHITIPRTIYLSTRVEISSTSDEIQSIRKVDRHLPHSKGAKFVYEISMPEYVFKSKKWLDYLKPVQGDLPTTLSALDTAFEIGTPLITRLLTNVGCICKLRKGTVKLKNKSYFLNDLVRVDRPSDMEYLCKELSYRRLFLYVRIHPKTKTGIVVLFTIDGGSGSFNKTSTVVDLTRPSATPKKTYDASATSHIWIVKPNSKNAQRVISLKQCESMFSSIMESIQGDVAQETEYSQISPESTVKIASLKFVDTEALAVAGANESISNYSISTRGATMILLNSSSPINNLRRHMTMFSSIPVLSMAFPPGPAHNPFTSTLPALNWEQPAVQLGLEAYLYMNIVAFPKRVSYARYGHIPLGNLGHDENTTTFETCLARLIQKNRAVSWANAIPGRPDLGSSLSSSSSNWSLALQGSGTVGFNQDDIWGDDDDLVSPVVRKPGCYRSVCIDIDIQDLAIAAISSAAMNLGVSHATNTSSPTSAADFGSVMNVAKSTGPLGDEMATSISFPIFRALINGWLKDAMTTGSVVADELLHRAYALLSNPETLFFDPALHRAVHSLMKATFLQFLTELQRLGCEIVFASFHKVTVATNKHQLADAEEYIQFVIDTAKRQANDRTEALSKVALKTRQFHSNLVFLDEYNFGTLALERVSLVDIEDGMFDIAVSDGASTDFKVIPSVVTAWSMMNYLGSMSAQEYFRALVAKFSKDVFRKQMHGIAKADSGSFALVTTNDNDVHRFKKTMISKHFATFLTRAVGEILNEDFDQDAVAPLQNESRKTYAPVLEFVKNVIKVLELDTEIENEVQALKRSLFTQIGVAEYSEAARWTNPCPTYILPDMFCTECHEGRDLNLCYIPPRYMDEEIDTTWACEECSTPYDVHHIESRLIQRLQRNIVRYQIQDIRCSKTNRLSSRSLSKLSNSSAKLKLDIPQSEIQQEIRLLRNVADLHNLEVLKETLDSILNNFRL